MAIPVIVRIMEIVEITPQGSTNRMLFIRGVVRGNICHTTVTRAELIAIPAAQRQEYVAQKLATERYYQELAVWSPLYGEITIEFTPPP